MSIVLYIILGLIVCTLCCYLENKIFHNKHFLNVDNYPADIILDKDNQLNMVIAGVPKPIYFFKRYDGELFGKSQYQPIVCEDKKTFLYYKNIFKTCEDVWNWEKQEFEKYRTFVEEYIKKNS